MARLRKNALPTYRFHKQSGQAVVTLSGRDFLLGPHGSAASRAEYDRRVGEWVANGRRPLATDVSPTTVNELILAYWRHCRVYYTKNGSPTSEIDSIEAALGPLKELYGSTAVRDFSARNLLTVRERMIQGHGWARKTINGHVARVRRMFKWGVPHELVPGSVFHALTAVDGLRRGRSVARETDPVRPVPDAHVDAVIAALSPSLAQVNAHHERLDQLPEGPAREQVRAAARRFADRVPGESPVAAMIQIQRLSGMRPGEVVILRGCDLDVTENPWQYTPPRHKGEHLGRSRQIFFGPRAQDVLRPFLRTDPHAPLFRPADAAAARHQWMRQLRKTPVQPSQVDRSKRNPKRSPGLRYDAAAYRRAVDYACTRANVPHWHPNQLRHNAATLLRRKFGLEAARVVLGHSHAATTEIYAEIDAATASNVMAKVG